MNLSLRQKILLGYLVMIAFTLIVGIFAIWSLTELNIISTEIIFNDVKAEEKITKLNDCLLAQDLYEKRFLTFRQPEAEGLFWTKSRECKSLVDDVDRIAESSIKSLPEKINTYHDDYILLFSKEASLIGKGKITEAQEISGSALSESFNKVLMTVKDLDLKIKGLQNHHINKSNSLGQRALMITIVLSVFSIVFGVLFASLLTSHLTTAIDKLKEAANSIRSGNFDNIPEIKGDDELADLAISFKEMSTRLKELEQMNLDANPLTKLPGNLAIEKELLTRLNETQTFSFCLIDLDNFKAFNDRYGYARGSDVINWMGGLLSGIKKELGSAEDFLGHIGGDDFVLICSPERVHALCSRIIEEFDKGIVNFYDPEDLKKGFIVSLDRADKPAIFSIMTLSIAVVNTDRTLIREPKEIALKVTEIKQYAKTFGKSLYVMDRRRSR